MKKFMIILLTMLALASVSSFGQKKYAKGGNESVTSGMVKIPGGTFQPFLKIKNQSETIKIHSFYLDVHAVTNAEFLAFVKASPQWARSNISPLLAEGNYLKQWAGDFKIGNDKILNSPVTNISWFAAEAYAEWKGKRLPTVQEWEYAASTGPVNIKTSQNLSAIILDWYSRPTPDVIPEVESTFKNKYGVYDMHGLIWEWVYDFNSIITGGDSRSAGNLSKNLYCAAGSLNAVDKEDYASFMRFAFRESLKAAYTIPNLGFRCAMDTEKAK